MRKISAMRKIPAAWNVLALITGCLLLSSWTAHAAKELLAQQSIEIDASPKAVWALVKDYNGVHKWHPAFQNDVIKSGKNNKRGAIRTLTLQSGESFDEQLLYWNDQKRYLRYRIVGDSPFPVTDYVSTLAVQKSKTGRTKLTWQGKFKNKEGSGKTDGEVLEMINGAYKAGLENVKALAEKG
jgi:mxaD protein